MSHYYDRTDYPYVRKTTDPLLIRFDKLSLLVGNTNFYAKIKNGIAFSGFEVYISGGGYPVYKKSYSTNTNTFKESNWKVEDIENDACAWLNKLEQCITDTDTDTSLSKSIDMLCWQLHTDLTGISQSVPSYYEQVDTLIDKTNSNVVSTVHELDYNMNNSSSGTLVNVFNSIYDLDTNLNDSTLGTMIMLGDRIAPANYDIYTSNNLIATNLRASNDEYTISKALRDKSTSDNSVSYSVKEQTTLESNNFSQIESSIGNSSDSITSNSLYGKLNKVNNSIGSSTDTTTDTLFGYNSVLNNSISSGSSSMSGITTTVTNIENRLGANSSTSGTVWYDILHNAGTKEKGITVEANSPIAWTRDQVLNKIGDSSTTNTLWYDVLHNSGTSDNTAGYSTNSCVGKIITAINS